MDPVTFTRWKKTSLLLSFSEMKVLLWHQNQVIAVAMKICSVLLNLYVYFYYNLYIYKCWAFACHYCVSHILQHIETVNKIWCYKQLFFKLCLWVKYNLKQNMYIAVIWLSSYSSFFFLFTFQFFSSVCFLLFFGFFCTPPHNQENYDSK